MGSRELIALVSAIMAFLAVGLDLMLPAFDEIRADFDLGVSSTETSRIVTVYMLGLASGQLLFGPLADRFGRKNAFYASAVIYIGGSVVSAVVGSFDVLLASRFVWGIGASGARVVATAIIRDRFEGAAMAKAMSNVMAVFVLAPVVAPSLGAIIVAVAPWRAVFWACAVFAAVVVVWSLRLRETLQPADRRPLHPATIASGYWQVARTRTTFGYTVATIFIQAAFTAYIASVEIMTAQIFDREAQFPYIFGAVAVLFGIAAIINGSVVERLGIDGIVNRGLVMVAVLTTALVIVTVFAQGTPNFWIFMPLLGLALSSFMFLMPNLNSAAMEPLGAIAGSGSALTGAVRIGVGAAIGGAFAEQVSDSVVPLVVCIAAMIALTALSVWLVRVGGVRALLGSAPRSELTS